MPISTFSGINGADDKVNLAASRAAQQLQLQYGVRAAGSINAIQDRMDQQQQKQQQNDESDDQAEAQPSVTQQNTTAPSAPQPANQVHPDNGQTDGAADELDVSCRGELSRAVIDGMLHQKMITSARAMEGGGLMLALKEDATRRPSRRAAKTALSGAKGKGKAIATFDGVDDDDDIDDEDAINSDLDDSQDENDDDEPDDEGLGHIMLCMYDKVQRVKNKWKCTLKDGVLTVNGKEYVFHKATGEYEW
ncbi:hypothetical protein CDD82_6357 [Ophiocordyceps australis]|uniref:Uncharacterized protein n=1 Tax=Ophiocordyceps australis TaxID=1399860 RepID=A0A2C5ZSJ2_9HYPO|nr:hypothetical protein CDD82_6357 [Ophiocordyceps australis]